MEECDDGNGSNFDDCLDTCEDASCGDGFAQAGIEQCDDGDTDDTNGCTNACTLPSCGDGIVQAGEECDDGNTSNADGCLNTCIENVCGDGILNPEAESCDDGNTSGGDWCSASCVQECTFGDANLLSDNTCYLYVDQGLTWTQAKNYCESLNAHLTSIHTGQDNNDVQGLSAPETVWTGLNKETLEALPDRGSGKRDREKAPMWSMKTGIRICPAPTAIS